MNNSAWKCSFGGAQIPEQTKLFITILIATIIKGYSLQEKPALSGCGQVSFIWFGVCCCADMCISFCHPYLGKDLGNLQCVSACSWAMLCYCDWISWAISMCAKRRQKYSVVIWACSWFCLVQVLEAWSGRLCIQFGFMKQNVGLQN